MVQLTLPGSVHQNGLQEELMALRRDWARSVGDGTHLAAAVRATEARFAGWGERDLDSRERQRAASYFSAVVRRAVARSGDAQAREARRRLLAASIEADLRDAGWDARRASAEAARVTRSGSECCRGAA